MNALGLAHITSLAVTLRQTLEGANTRRDNNVMPVPELSLVVRAWADEAGAAARAGEATEDVPPAWITDANRYVEALCQAIGRLRGSEVPWRR